MNIGEMDQFETAFKDTAQVLYAHKKALLDIGFDDHDASNMTYKLYDKYLEKRFNTKGK